MNIPEISKINNNLIYVKIDDHNFYYSYETCICYWNDKLDLKLKINNFFSKTTSKHMNMLNTGDFIAMDENDFCDTIKKIQ